MSRILVVEDEPNNLELALRIVRHAGHDATVATDGVTALELARRVHPELILLDLQLPKLDGWTVVRELRGEPGPRASRSSRSRRRRPLETSSRRSPPAVRRSWRSRITPPRSGTCSRGIWRPWSSQKERERTFAR